MWTLLIIYAHAGGNTIEDTKHTNAYHTQMECERGAASLSWLWRGNVKPDKDTYKWRCYQEGK